MYAVRPLLPEFPTIRVLFREDSKLIVTFKDGKMHILWTNVLELLRDDLARDKKTFYAAQTYLSDDTKRDLALKRINEYTRIMKNLGVGDEIGTADTVRADSTRADTVRAEANVIFDQTVKTKSAQRMFVSIDALVKFKSLMNTRRTKTSYVGTVIDDLINAFRINESPCPIPPEPIVTLPHEPVSVYDIGLNGYNIKKDEIEIWHRILDRIGHRHELSKKTGSFSRIVKPGLRGGEYISMIRTIRKIPKLLSHVNGSMHLDPFVASFRSYMKSSDTEMTQFIVPFMINLYSYAILMSVRDAVMPDVTMPRVLTSAEEELISKISTDDETRKTFRFMTRYIVAPYVDHYTEESHEKQLLLIPARMVLEYTRIKQVLHNQIVTNNFMLTNADKYGRLNYFIYILFDTYRNHSILTKLFDPTILKELCDRHRTFVRTAHNITAIERSKLSFKKQNHLSELAAQNQLDLIVQVYTRNAYRCREIMRSGGLLTGNNLKLFDITIRVGFVLDSAGRRSGEFLPSNILRLNVTDEVHDLSTLLKYLASPQIMDDIFKTSERTGFSLIVVLTEGPDSSGPGLSGFEPAVPTRLILHLWNINKGDKTRPISKMLIYSSIPVDTNSIIQYPSRFGCMIDYFILKKKFTQSKFTVDGKPLYRFFGNQFNLKEYFGEAIRLKDLRDYVVNATIYATRYLLSDDQINQLLLNYLHVEGSPLGKLIISGGTKAAHHSYHVMKKNYHDGSMDRNAILAYYMVSWAIIHRNDKSPDLDQLKYYHRLSDCIHKDDYIESFKNEFKLLFT